MDLLQSLQAAAQAELTLKHTRAQLRGQDAFVIYTTMIMT